MDFFSKLIIIVLIILAVMYAKDNFIPDNDETIFTHKNNQIEEPAFNPPIETTPEPTRTNNPQSTSTLVSIYYTSTTNGALKKVTKELPQGQNKLNFAIKELLNGPNFQEKSNGFSSEIPKGTKLLNLKDEGGIIIIDVSDEFQYGGGTESQYTRIKQLIKTVVGLNLNKPVYLYINGKKAETIGGEGIIITQPLSENSLNG